MDEKDRHDAIIRIAATDGFKAVMEIIDDAIATATDEVADATNAVNHGILARAAGGLRWLRELKLAIEANTVDSKPEDPPKERL